MAILPIYEGRNLETRPLTRDELEIARTQRFGVVVRVIRERMGISKEELAAKAHLPVSYIEELESMTLGMKDLSGGVVIRIGGVLGEEPNSLAIRAQFHSLWDLPLRSQRADVEVMRQAAEAIEEVTVQT